MEEGAEELMDNPIQKSNVKKLRSYERVQQSSEIF